MTTTIAAASGALRCSSIGWATSSIWLATFWITCVISSAYGRDCRTICCARRMRDAAISSIALVIRFVDSIERMRRRVSRSFAPIYGAPADPSPAGPAFSRNSSSVGRRYLRSRSCSSSVRPSASSSVGAAAGPEGTKSRLNSSTAARSCSSTSGGKSPFSRMCWAISGMVRVEPGVQALLEPLGVGRREVVDQAVGDEPDRDDLLLHRHRLVLRLLQHLHDAPAAVELRLRRLVQLGPELGERLQGAELREVEPQAAGHLLHRLDLRVAADARDGDADVDRRDGRRS